MRFYERPETIARRQLVQWQDGDNGDGGIGIKSVRPCSSCGMLCWTVLLHFDETLDYRLEAASALQDGMHLEEFQYHSQQDLHLWTQGSQSSQWLTSANELVSEIPVFSVSCCNIDDVGRNCGQALWWIGDIFRLTLGAKCYSVMSVSDYFL